MGGSSQAIQLRLRAGWQLVGVSVAWAAGCHSCLMLLDVCQRFWWELCRGDLSSPCMLCRCAVLQQEQDKRVTLIHPHSISIDIFGPLIGITFKMLLYYGCLSWLITQ